MEKKLVEFTTFFERLQSLVLVNTRVLTEIVVATECLVATRERTHKC